MNKRTFNINNHIYKRITKTEARRLFNNDNAILIAPVNYNINSPWHVEDILDKHYDAQDFDITVNAYTFYNCNNELGSYPAFYAIDNRKEAR